MAVKRLLVVTDATNATDLPLSTLVLDHYPFVVVELTT